MPQFAHMIIHISTDCPAAAELERFAHAGERRGEGAAGIDLTDEAAVESYYRGLVELWAAIHGAGGFAMAPVAEAGAAAGAADATAEPSPSPCSFFVPGLVDCHVHLNGIGDGRAGDELTLLPDEVRTLQAARNARAHLYSGVTTVRACGEVVPRSSVQGN